MFKRKIEYQLKSWLEDRDHKPLVVKGVRQCGKTSSVMDFAKKHFKNVVYIDFHEHPLQIIIVIIPLNTVWSIIL